ncbi:hypothetical protein LEMLEM_LOCUS5345, partial [Lemmus lemmus]
AACSACTTGWNASRELSWRLKNICIPTDRDGDMVILDTRMLTLLCSRPASIGLWPRPSSGDLLVAGPPETPLLPSRSRAQSSCRHR